MAEHNRDPWFQFETVLLMLVLAGTKRLARGGDTRLSSNWFHVYGGSVWTCDDWPTGLWERETTP